MNIHEYQAKEIFRRYGIPTPKGVAAMNVDDAVKGAESLIAETGNEVVVVKAQIHAGGRGKAGGVKVVKGVDAAREAANDIFGKVLVTHQTGPEGKK
ncbi:MAG: ATP-grasp domain-containing protein, partial [Myxococcota bacterium]